jgi:uncharacterized protein (TIGR00369 family)
VDDASHQAPPAGFAPMVSKAPFLEHIGPFYERIVDGRLQRCFRVARQHANGLGLVHGGMMSAFMDGVLAQVVVRDSGMTTVTVSLSLDYLRMARAGDWIIGEARLLRATRDIAFAEGRAFVGEVDIMRASGVFKLFPKR